MNTATQLVNAPSMPGAQQPAILPVNPQAMAAGGQGAVGEPQTFDAQLQTLLETPVVASAQAPADAARTAPEHALADGATDEQALEQAEALLGLLGAQQQQQVQAQPLRQGAHPAAPQPEAGPQPVAAPLAAQMSITQASTTATLPRADSAAAPAASVAIPPETQALQEALSAAGATRPATEVAGASLAPNTAQPAATGAVADRLLRLEGNDAQRGEQMLQALRNNVQLQLQNNQQIATIRLDPPELGSLEIQVNQDAGRISIQISAAQADTLRLLQLTSDRLRHELLAQQFVQVNVQVGGEGRSGQQSRQNPGGSGDARVRGNPLNDGGLASQHSAPRDVLATA